MKAIQYRQYANVKQAAKEPKVKAQPFVSVIIPFLNEADVLAVCHQRVCDALSLLKQPWKSSMLTTVAPTPAGHW